MKHPFYYDAVTHTAAGHYIVPLAKLTKLIHSQTVVHHKHVAHQFSNSVSSHPENNVAKVKVKVVHLYPVHIKCISLIPTAAGFSPGLLQNTRRCLSPG
jgi:hypothetical protein